MSEQMELSPPKSKPSPINGGLKSIPGPKPKMVLGNLKEIPFEQFHRYLKEKASLYGPVFKLALAQKNMVVLSNPETVRNILKNRPTQYRRISAMQEVFSELGINGVFSAEGAEWKVQRQMMNQAFKANQLIRYYPIITQTTDKLVDVLSAHSDKADSFDFQALMQRFTIDITTQLAFGHDVNTLGQGEDGSEFQEKCAVVFPMISYRIKAPFPYWRYFKLKKDKELDAAMDYIRSHCDQFIAQAEAKVKQQTAPNNILESMIMARDEEGIAFTHQQLFANIVTLLLAGEDTTANTLGWVIHYLTENPQYQTQLQKEIQDAVTTLDLSDPKSLDQLPLLNAVIQEAMRLMPVAALLYIENIEDQVIEGYDIPAGTMLALMLSQTGHMESDFPEPELFKPERWLEMDNDEKKHAAKTLMHFGSGARLCPGMQLSYLEMKYALIAMLKQFTFHKDKQYETRDLFAFTVMPQNLLVRVEKAN